MTWSEMKNQLYFTKHIKWKCIHCGVSAMTQKLTSVQGHSVQNHIFSLHIENNQCMRKSGLFQCDILKQWQCYV